MKIWYLWFLLRIAVQSYIYSGRPVPKADLLEEVLARFMNRSEYSGSLFNYLAGNDDFGDPDNLDVCILDSNNIFKIIGAAKKKYQTYFRRTKREAIEVNPRLVYMAMDLMKQSLYATRYRLKDTKRYRLKYTKSIRFNMAIFYGALMQISLKIETLYANMKTLPWNTHFLWYLILYEKILAAHVDIDNMVERIFDLHYKQLNRDEGMMVEIMPTLPTPPRSRKRSRGTARTFTTRPIMTIKDGNNTIDGGGQVYDDPTLATNDPYSTKRTTTTTLPRINTTTELTTTLDPNATYPEYENGSSTTTRRIITAKVGGTTTTTRTTVTTQSTKRTQRRTTMDDDDGDDQMPDGPPGKPGSPASPKPTARPTTPGAKGKGKGKGPGKGPGKGTGKGTPASSAKATTPDDGKTKRRRSTTMNKANLRKAAKDEFYRRRFRLWLR